MQTQTQEKKDVFLHIVELSQDLMNMVKNATFIGRKIILNSIDEAKTEYLKPIKDPIKGYIYSRSRKRAPYIDDCISQMLKDSSSLNQITQFKALISQGQWNIGSFNALLFLTLIRKINVYALPEDKVMHEQIMPRLKILLFQRIDGFIKSISERTALSRINKTSVKIEFKSGRINVENFGNIASLFDRDQAKTTTRTNPEPKRLNLSNYDKVALLFDKKGTMHQRPKPGRIKNLDDFAAIANLFVKR